MDIAKRLDTEVDGANAQKTVICPMQQKLRRPTPSLIYVIPALGRVRLQYGYRETDGRTWFPPFDEHRIWQISRVQAFELVSAPGLPLVGHNHPPTLDWLPEPEEHVPKPSPREVIDLAVRRGLTSNCILLVLPHATAMRHKMALQQERFDQAYLNPVTGTDSGTRDDPAFQRKDANLNRARLDGDNPLEPTAAYAIIESLIASFDRVERRKFFKKVHLKEAQRRAKALASAARELEGEDSPSCKHLSAECQKEAKRQKLKADIFRWEIEHDGGESASLEEFIREHLSSSYRDLFGRCPASTPNGPFARFGERFFALVGYPVKSGTITSALKGRPQSGRR